MTLVSDLDLPMIDIFAPGIEKEFHHLVAQLRDEGHWLARTPLGLTIFDHDAVWELMRDTRLRPVGTRLLEMQGLHDGPVYERFAKALLNLEGAEHTRLRRLVSRAFTPRSADRLRPMMRDWVDERATAMAGAGGGDFVADLAEAYPIAVICELVGAPKEDWPRFSSWANDAFRIFNMNLAEDLPIIQAAQIEMFDYVAGLIAQRRTDPGEDLITELLRVEEEGDRLTEDELRSLVGTLLLAGTDTTRNQLGLAVLLFAGHPDQWDRLVEDPDLVPRAVDEVLRFEPTASATPRIPIEDFEYRGVTIPAGTFLSLGTSSANRDPSHVSCPMHFDVGADRGQWSPLTFGGGMHYCLGASLARAELQEALGVLARRWRRIELAGRPTMKPFVGIYGPTSLPIRVEAR